ncbi:MAG: LPXTG cell wall anchor domain-containing protein, partial [Acidimicrobiia bacterium]|nr:LPXTG cell wall anchor domain-containing protein [Acidimicrobiia bacterium]
IVPAQQLRPSTEVTEVASSSTRIVAPAIEVLGASAAQPSATATEVLAETLPMTGIDTSDLSLIAAVLMTLGGTLLGVTRRKNVSPIA